jgi:hypothetical protein
MGYRAWQALGHQVRKGEKSISILAPCTYRTSRNEDDDQDDTQTSEKGAARRVLRGFRIAHVFDISSTDGDTVRPPAGPDLLDGEAPVGLWDALAAQVAAEGFTLVRDAIPSGANGTTNFATRTVTVADHLCPAQAAKTLAHDLLAHTCLHDGTEYAMGCRGRAEVEAESVAFIVCQAAGLTTAAYSFGYVAGWSAGDPKKVKATAERVVTCARQILDRAGLLDPTADDAQEAQAA